MSEAAEKSSGNVLHKALVLGVWAAAMLLAYFYAAMDVGYALEHGGWRSGSDSLLGRDFVNVFTAGHVVLEGRLDILYDLDAYREYQRVLFDGRVINHNYSYPPISFFYVWLFALTPYGWSYALWAGATGLAFMLAARPYLRESGLPAWLVVLIPASIANLWAGHYGFLLAALWLGGWRLVDSRPRLAGLLFGLLFVKPHLGLLIPLVLAWRRSWAAMGWAAATVCGLVLASGLAFGWGHWVAYVSDTLTFQAALVNRTGEFFLAMMPTVVPSMRHAGFSGTAAWAVQAVAAAAAVAVLLRWLPRGGMQAGLATATATFLVLPYAFSYDLTVVGVAALLHLHGSGRSLLHRAGAALVFLLPLILIPLNANGLAIGPIALALMLALLLKRDPSAASTEESRPLFPLTKPGGRWKRGDSSPSGNSPCATSASQPSPSSS